MTIAEKDKRIRELEAELAELKTRAEKAEAELTEAKRHVSYTEWADYKTRAENAETELARLRKEAFAMQDGNIAERRELKNRIAELEARLENDHAELVILRGEIEVRDAVQQALAELDEDRDKDDRDDPPSETSAKSA